MKINPVSTYIHAQKALDGYVEKVNSKYLLSRAQKEIGAKTYHKLAEVLPVTEEAEINLSRSRGATKESGVSACKTKYSDIFNLKTTIKRGSFLETKIIEIVGEGILGFDELPLKTILANPLANKSELGAIKQCIAQFYADDKTVSNPVILNPDGSYKYNHLYSSYEGQMAFNNIEMLALRLVLHREAALGVGIPENFDYSLKGSLLLFLRLLINEGLESIQDELLKLIFIFYEINENNHIPEEKIWHILEDKDSSDYLQKLFQKILPEGAKLQPFMLSLDGYLENNREIKRVIKDQVLDSIKETPYYDIDYQFCVDYYCDEWLSGEMQRTDLLKPSFKYFDQLKRFILSEPPTITIW